MLDIAQLTGLQNIQHIGIGLAFVIFPILFIIGFAVHPNLFRPRRIKNVDDWVSRIRHNSVLQFGHVMVLLSTPLLIVVALHCMALSTEGSLAWLGLVGGVSAICGAVILAADKGALGLVVSAFDTLPDDEFDQLKPALVVMQTKAGWLRLLQALALLPIGFALLAISLLSTGAFPIWQAIILLCGTLLLAAPDGFEIISLLASVLLAVALIPYGLQFLL
jgi:hypothetical protein